MVKRGIAMDYNQYRLLEPKDLEIQKSITFSQKYSESGRRALRPIRAPQLDTTKRVRRRQWGKSAPGVWHGLLGEGNTFLNF